MRHRNPAEYAPLEDTYSPVLHRILQVIRRRAVDPIEEVPPAPEILTKYSKIPDMLSQKVKPYLETLIKEADVKKGIDLAFRYFLQSWRTNRPVALITTVFCSFPESLAFLSLFQVESSYIYANKIS